MCVFCIWTCSAQLSMFHMERHSRNVLIIISSSSSSSGSSSSKISQDHIDFLAETYVSLLVHLTCFFVCSFVCFCLCLCFSSCFLFVWLVDLGFCVCVCVCVCFILFLFYVPDQTCYVTLCHSQLALGARSPPVVL